MKVTLSKNSGFCPGVRRADTAVRELLLRRTDTDIFTLGNLIHNRLYNEELRAMGVRKIEVSELEDTLKAQNGRDTTLIIRTHGITKELEAYLKGLEVEYENLHVMDMTCPYVKRIHKIADENTDDGTLFLLYCDPNHPEAIGILSYAHGEKLPFSSIDELEKLDFSGKTPLLCSQTTQNISEFKKIKNRLSY